MKLWRVLTWNPIRGWEATLFHVLWSWTLVFILFGWWDTTVHFDAPVTDEQVEVLEEPDWSAPLYLGNGRCVVVQTREMIDC
jgi:hypothetical protein